MQEISAQKYRSSRKRRHRYIWGPGDKGGSPPLTKHPSPNPSVGQFPFDLLQLGAEMKVGNTPHPHTAPRHGAPEGTQDPPPLAPFFGNLVDAVGGGRLSPVLRAGHAWAAKPLAAWPGPGISAPTPPHAGGHQEPDCRPQAFPSTGGEGGPRGSWAERRKG